MDRLPRAALERTANRLLDLETNARPRGCRKLRGREEYRLRVGEYRILYTVNDKERVVEIVAVRRRRDAYRRG